MVSHYFVESVEATTQKPSVPFLEKYISLHTSTCDVTLTLLSNLLSLSIPSENPIWLLSDNGPGNVQMDEL